MSINQTPNDQFSFPTLLPKDSVLIKTPNENHQPYNSNNLRKDLESIFNQFQLENSQLVKASYALYSNKEKVNEKVAKKNNDIDNDIDDNEIGNKLISINQGISNESNKKVIVSPNDLKNNFNTLKKETILINYDNDEVNHENETIKAKIIDTVLLSQLHKSKSIPIANNNKETQEEDLKEGDSGLAVSIKIAEPEAKRNQLKVKGKLHKNGYSDINNNRVNDNKNNNINTNNATPVDRIAKIEINNNKNRQHSNEKSEEENPFKLLSKDEIKHKTHLNSNVNNKLYTNTQTPCNGTPLDNGKDKKNNNANDNEEIQLRKINIVIPEPKDIMKKGEVTYNGSSRNEMINKVSIQSFNVNNLSIKQRQNNKLYSSLKLFNSYVFQSQIQDIELITNLEPVYTPKIPYSELLLSKTKMNIDIVKQESVQKRNAILSNKPFSSIISNKDKNKGVPSINYQKKLFEDYVAIEHQYSLLFVNISMEEKTKLYQLLMSSSTIELAQSNLNHLSHLYKKANFIDMLNYQHNEDDLTFDYYRLFESNGDSFYRVFMFSYIEYLLINKKNKELLALFIDILRLQDCNEYVYKQIVIKDTMIFLSILSDLIQSNQYNKAYQIFISAYVHPKTKESVDDVLVRYLKWCLFSFQYEELFKEGGDKDKDDNKAIKKSNYNAFNKQNILNPNMEPSVIVFESIPYVFNVNLKIYWIEGDNENSNFNICEFNTNDKDNENIITINIGYFYTGYNCVYISNELNNNDIFNKVNEQFIIQVQSLQIVEGLALCSKCNQGKTVYFHKIKKGICYQCIMNGINGIITQRAKYFVQESFLNLEYYCDTLYFNDNTLAINNNDLLVISNQTIPQIMTQRIEITCFSCFNQFDKSELLQLQCSCKYCRPCLLFKLKEVTEGKMILNRYEMTRCKKSQCLCKGTLNITEIAEILNESFTEEKEKAKERFTQIGSSVCSYCSTTIQLDDQVKANSKKAKPKPKGIRFKIQNQLNDDLIPGIDFLDQEHIICIKCIRKLGVSEINRRQKIDSKDNTAEVITEDNDNKELKNKDKDKVIKDKDKEKEKIEENMLLHCNICDLDHYVDTKKFEIKRYNICCAQPCIIF